MNRRFQWERVVRAYPRATLPPSTKLVALTLATYADGDGTSAHPGVPRLASDTGLSERVIIAALRRLREAGLVVRTERGSKQGRRAQADEYRLAYPLPRSPDRASGDRERDRVTRRQVIGRDHLTLATRSHDVDDRITRRRVTPPEQDQLSTTPPVRPDGREEAPTPALGLVTGPPASPARYRERAAEARAALTAGTPAHQPSGAVE